MKKKIIAAVLVVVLLIGGTGLFYISGKGHVSSKSEVVQVTVKKGENAYTVLNTLDSKGLIKNKLVAKVYLKIHKPSVISQTYNLNKNMSLSKMYSIISKMSSSYVVKSSLTIPEGITIPQAAKKVANVTGKSEQEVLDKWSDQTYLKELISKYWFLTDDILQKGILYPLEGYLYPETYVLYDKSTTIEKVTTEMLDYMDQQLTPYKDSMTKLGYTPHQFLTLCSVVERESLFDKDRPVIAGVFINRLKTGKRLQSDITVNYALNRTGVKVTTKMTKIDSPYNTYKYAGLPIGPIACVPQKTMNAVANYTPSDYLFFFAKKDGTVIYSKTYEEHQKAVKENKWY